MAFDLQAFEKALNSWWGDAVHPVPAQFIDLAREVERQKEGDLDRLGALERAVDRLRSGLHDHGNTFTGHALELESSLSIAHRAIQGLQELPERVSKHDEALSAAALRVGELNRLPGLLDSLDGALRMLSRRVDQAPDKEELDTLRADFQLMDRENIGVLNRVARLEEIVGAPDFKEVPVTLVYDAPLPQWEAVTIARSSNGFVCFQSWSKDLSSYGGATIKQMYGFQTYAGAATFCRAVLEKQP